MEITIDALTALMATASDLANDFETEFQLIRPKDQDAAFFLAASGFNDLVENAPKHEEPPRGLFWRRSGNRVEPAVARTIREFTELAFSEFVDKPVTTAKLNAIYRTVIECMSNTHGHASRDGAIFADWWVSAYCDTPGRKVMYCFVDSGIGILKSANVSNYRKLAGYVGLDSSDKILRDVFDGQIQSRTEQPGRGEGLPAMKNDCVVDRLIDNLSVVTNNVRTVISSAHYELLDVPFVGTLVYWELCTE